MPSLKTYKETYRLDKRPLGKGGFAVVHRATHRHTGEDFALKVLHSDSEEARLRLKREIEVQTSLLHEHVMPIVDHDIENGWYAMPIANRSLESLDRPLQDESLFPIVNAIGSALVVAHRCGYVHRDVTPRNILELSVDFAPLVSTGAKDGVFPGDVGRITPQA